MKHRLPLSPLFLLMLASICCLLLTTHATAATRRILFIGNSFTTHHKLPDTVGAIATSRGHSVSITNASKPGFMLASHIADADTQAKIDEGNWDFVVMQEQSFMPVYAAINSANRLSFAQDIATLYDRIKLSSSAAKIVLYETWAYKPTHSAYEFDPASGGSPAVMQARLTLAYKNAAADLIASGRTDIEIARVGTAREVNRTHLNIDMFEDDYHPDPEGSYLAGLVIYSTIFNATPIGIRYVSPKVPAITAAAIRTIARYVADIAPPNPPVSVTPVITNGRVKLTWSAADRAVTYRVQRATTAGGKYSTVASGVTATSFTSSTLTPGKSYYYVVSAVNPRGESPPSYPVVVKR